MLHLEWFILNLSSWKLFQSAPFKMFHLKCSILNIPFKKRTIIGYCSAGHLKTPSYWIVFAVYRFFLHNIVWNRHEFSYFCIKYFVIFVFFIISLLFVINIVLLHVFASYSIKSLPISMICMFSLSFVVLCTFWYILITNQHYQQKGDNNGR